MAAPQSPVGSRRRLGAELRRLRLKTGLTLDDVAERMTCSTSKISRLETGKGVPKIPDVRELMRIYGVASDTERDMLVRLVHDGRGQGWWESYVEGVQPERFVMDSPGRYAALETEATTVRAFEVSWLHGLLQSPEYARVLLEAVLADDHDAGEIDRLVEMRVRRQQALADREPPLRLDVVLDEAVLARTVALPGIGREALQFVLDLSARPNIVVRVLPFGAGLHRSQAGSFVVLEYPVEVGADVVYIEGHAGETYLEGDSDVDLYKDVLNDASARALDPGASRELIRRYQDTRSPGKARL
ncbi:helix-turn-helix transcriptional regulator [Pseudonocardia sp.]|jgi:transcriptional regulator with XRE-family HTH domain|uniref:helix-turn-helix domain-containing protein n=1 Tax=Pseudonocardia sp. TaxID=60912 RepID=UPI00261D4823|nr:helix-turn-helix transcriptional regulator [Pseudonocardia sp.]MCW2721920.1 helix-turn-helix domain protein [Pseudonocardia sp.]MDT7616913.1 hypothetical protein [Pseudonocardiales bacterium]